MCIDGVALGITTESLGDVLGGRCLRAVEDGQGAAVGRRERRAVAVAVAMRVAMRYAVSIGVVTAVFTSNLSE